MSTHQFLLTGPNPAVIGPGPGSVPREDLCLSRDEPRTCTCPCVSEGRESTSSLLNPQITDELVFVCVQCHLQAAQGSEQCEAGNRVTLLSTVDSSFTLPVCSAKVNQVRGQILSNTAM